MFALMFMCEILQDFSRLSENVRCRTCDTCDTLRTPLEHCTGADPAFELRRGSETNLHVQKKILLLITLKIDNFHLSVSKTLFIFSFCGILAHFCSRGCKIWHDFSVIWNSFARRGGGLNPSNPPLDPLLRYSLVHTVHWTLVNPFSNDNCCMFMYESNFDAC